MPEITLYPLNQLAPGVQHMLTQRYGGAPAVVVTGTGWTVGTVASANFARMDSQTERASGTFTGTAQPNGAPDNSLGDSFISPTPWYGRIEAGTFTISFSVRAVTAGGTQDGRMRFRLWRSANADGSGAVEITAGAVQCTIVTNLATSAAQVSSGTFALGAAVTLVGEYLFIQLAWEITGAGGGATNDVLIELGGNTFIITPDFTPIWPAPSSSVPSTVRLSPAQVLDPVLRAEYDKGYVMTRPRFSRDRRNWVLLYQAITEVQRNIFFNFVRDLRGSALTFEWVHPFTSEVFPKMALILEEDTFQHERLTGKDSDTASYYHMQFRFEERF